MTRFVRIPTLERGNEIERKINRKKWGRIYAVMITLAGIILICGSYLVGNEVFHNTAAFQI
ncbi:hypothetical protein ISS30_03565 [bacterium]|nr:hypothetical protein [bacterium]